MTDVVERTGRRTLGRRELLVGVLTVATASLAGCVDARTEFHLEVADEEAIVETVAQRVDPDGEARDVVAEAVATGEAVTEGITQPIDERRAVEFEGAYYRLEVDSQVIGSDTICSIEATAIGDAPVDGEVELEALTSTDRAAVTDLVPDRPDEDFSGEDRHVYRNGAVEASQLLGETVVVVVDSMRYRVEARVGEVHDRREFTYTATRVAGDGDSFVEWARERYAVGLDGLDGSAREIVEEARDGGYYGEDVSEGYRSLIEYLRDHRAIETTEYSGTWLVRYEGETYIAETFHPTDLGG